MIFDLIYCPRAGCICDRLRTYIEEELQFVLDYVIMIHTPDQPKVTILDPDEIMRNLKS